MNATVKNTSPSSLLTTMQNIVSTIESHTSRNAYGKAGEVKRITRATIESHRAAEPESSEENHKPHTQWRRELNQLEQVDRWIMLVEAEIPPVDWCGGSILSVHKGLKIIIDRLADRARAEIKEAEAQIDELQSDLSQHEYRTTDEGAGLLKWSLVDLGTMKAYRYEFNNVLGAYDS
jgi:hypothetical protein